MTWQHVLEVTWPAALIIGAAIAAILVLEYAERNEE